MTDRFDGELSDDDLSGLQWLSQQRPEAMEHLLAFFRESGRHLDPKTRFLISIVTKVINYSPRGLRQYIPRARREGATRDEIIDAILCSYPAAGLTKVVDAIDVLRRLDLPNQEPADLGGEPAAPVITPYPAESLGPDGAWVPVLVADTLKPGYSRAITAGGQQLALFNVDGEFRAIDNRCLHQGSQLADGDVVNGAVTCPLHGWRFDTATGKCLSHPGQAVASYEVRVLDGQVEVRL